MATLWSGSRLFEVFSEVLANLQSGTNVRNIDLGGTMGRLRNIRFCLLEAKQEIDRAFMKSAATMVLLRDETHGRLLLRFATCTKNLGPTGYLGSPAGLWLPNRREFGKGNRAGAQTVLHLQVGEGPKL